jgi:hypothetical protein
MMMSRHDRPTALGSDVISNLDIAGGHGCSHEHSVERDSPVYVLDHRNPEEWCHWLAGKPAACHPGGDKRENAHKVVTL